MNALQRIGILRAARAICAVFAICLFSPGSPALGGTPDACDASGAPCPAHSVVGSDDTLQALYPPFVKRIGYNDPSYAEHVSPTSPSTIAKGDFVTKFEAPDGARVTVVIKSPVVSSTYTAPPPGAGEDPVKYFADIFAAAGSHATVVLPAGQAYNFKKINCTNSSKPDFAGAHLEIANVRDLVIDGNGGVLNFASNCVGLDIEQANRIVFKNFTIDWPNLQTAALATVTAANSNANGYTYDIQIQPQFLKGSLRQIMAATAWDTAHNYWSLAKSGQDVTYNTPFPVSADGSATGLPGYGVLFKKGQTVLIRAYFSGNAIVASGRDITFDNVTINSAPGLGYLFYGTGFHIENCAITRSHGRPISTTVDAIHTGAVGGDVVIENSTFAYQGDDGTNLHTTLNPIAKTGTDRIAVPSFIMPQAGDPVALFTSKMALTGYASVAAVDSNGGTDTLTLSKSIPAADAKGYLADLGLPAARYVIRNNRYLHNRARGVLLQSPYGLVENNIFTGQTYAHIYVVTSGFWGEGPGAQNILITGNHLSRSGASAELGAMVVGFEAKSGPVSYVRRNAPGTPPIPPVHQNIVFANNTISDEPRAGFYLSSANDVILYANAFQNLNQVSSLDYAGTTPSNAPTDRPVVVDDASNFLSCKNTFKDVGPEIYWTDPNTTVHMVLACKP